MLISSLTLRTATVPPGLIIAAIDFISLVRPEAHALDRAVMALALRLDYDNQTAMALALRVRATARLFADPRWPSVRRLGIAVANETRPLFEVTLQRFIATAPLGSDLTFDVGALQRMLTEALSPHGRC